VNSLANSQDEYIVVVNITALAKTCAMQKMKVVQKLYCCLSDNELVFVVSQPVKTCSKSVGENLFKSQKNSVRVKAK